MFEKLKFYFIPRYILLLSNGNILLYLCSSCTVRVVKSWRAGVGKTLYTKRLSEKLQSIHSDIVRTKKAVVSIHLHEREANIDYVMDVLLQNTLYTGKIEPRLMHFDLSHEVIQKFNNNFTMSI